MAAPSTVYVREPPPPKKLGGGPGQGSKTAGFVKSIGRRSRFRGGYPFDQSKWYLIQFEFSAATSTPFADAWWVPCPHSPLVQMNPLGRWTSAK